MLYLLCCSGIAEQPKSSWVPLQLSWLLPSVKLLAMGAPEQSQSSLCSVRHGAPLPLSPDWLADFNSGSQWSHYCLSQSGGRISDG